MKQNIDKSIIAELKRKLANNVGDPEKIKTALRNFGIDIKDNKA